MIGTYLTPEGMPVRTNCPQKNWQKISEVNYLSICNQKQKDFEDEQKALDELMAPKVERYNLIRQRAMDNAEQELIDEGTIQPKQLNQKEV